MKINIKIKFFAFVAALLVLSTNGVAQVEQQKFTDKAGYEYISYTNDPTALRIYTLKNGLKVYLSKNTDKPEIVSSIAVKAGSNNDPRNSTGLAHYFEHMMFKGTSTLGTANWAEEKKILKKIEKLFEKRRKETDPAKRDAIYAEIDKLSYEASKFAIPGEYDKVVTMMGASGTNAYTSYDQTVYQNTIPSNELERWLHLEADRFSDIVLRVFHTELETVYEEYNRGQDNDNRAMYMSIISKSLEGSNYQTTVIGEPEHLKNPSMTDIYKFAKDYYVPNNMAIILNGDLDYETTIALIDKEFGPLKPNKKLDRLKSNTLKGILAANEIGGKVNKIVDPEIEKLVLTYRFDPNSSQKRMISIVNYLLTSKIGMLTTDIIQTQKLLGVASFEMPFKYYSLYNFLGVPKPGQTLDDVKTILIQEIEKLQNGDFDYDVLTATLNNLKIDEETSYENNASNNQKAVDSFVNEKDWSETLLQVDNLFGVSKEEIVAFAKDFFNPANAMMTFKEKGEKTVTKVSKPAITPVYINRDAKSVMYSKIESMPVSSVINPVDADFSLIQHQQLGSVKWDFVENTRNRLFNLSLKFKMGSQHNSDLSYANAYINMLGTNDKSIAKIEREFYKLAISHSMSVGSEYTYLSISGLSENMEEGVRLVDEYISNLKDEREKFAVMIENMIKSRNEQKSNPSAIFSRLQGYAQYGEDSPYRDVYSDQRLRSLDTQELIKLAQSVREYEFEVYYYGKDNDKAKELVAKYFNTQGNYKVAGEKKEFEIKDAKGVIYFVDKKDMLQAQISEVAKGTSYDQDKAIMAELFNSYFGTGLSSVVFQEIRESRSLAYSAYSMYSAPSKSDKPFTFITFIGTQSDKLLEANSVMSSLLSDMPKYQEAFGGIVENFLKNIATQRITEKNVYNYYKSLENLGIDKSTIVYTYNKVKSVELNDLIDFFNSDIKTLKRDIVIIGNKADLDLEKLSKESGKKIVELDIDFLFNY